MPHLCLALAATVTLAALALLLAVSPLSWRVVERPLIERGRKARY